MKRKLTQFVSSVLVMLLLCPVPVLAQNVSQKKLSRAPSSQSESEFERAQEAVFEALDVLDEQGWEPSKADETIGTALLNYEAGETLKVLNEELDLGFTAIQDPDEEFAFTLVLSTSNFSTEYVRTSFAAGPGDSSLELHQRFLSTLEAMERQLIEIREDEVKQDQGFYKLLDLILPTAHADEPRPKLEKGASLIVAAFVVSSGLSLMKRRINTSSPLVLVKFVFVSAGTLVETMKTVQ